MKTIVKTAAALLALSGMTGQSLAAGLCARPDEALALKTAAMQQELMVAALYCGDVVPYNRFVISHQRELRDSDAALLTFFHRKGLRAGEAEYHSYKTALANTFSLNSLHGMRAYCDAAQIAFDEALDATRREDLATFISAQSVSGPEAYQCDRSAAETIPGGSSATRIASNRSN